MHVCIVVRLQAMSLGTVQLLIVMSQGDVVVNENGCLWSDWLAWPSYQMCVGSGDRGSPLEFFEERCVKGNNECMCACVHLCTCMHVCGQVCICSIKLYAHA